MLCKWQKLITFRNEHFQFEYEDDDEIVDDDDAKKAVNSKFEHVLEEEDPEVIKELILLIKKVGGLDELEKQLQMRLNLNQNSPIVGMNGKTTTTTVSPISKSLYNKVLNTKRGSFRNQNVAGNTRSDAETQPIVQRQNKENKYSSVIRNSRPRPQNDGIDLLSEIEGGDVIREKPKYTTITRTHAPKPQNADDDDDDEDSVQPVTAASTDEELDETEAPNRSSTHQPTYQYVNIQRPRPSSTAAPAGDEENESDVEDELDDTTTVKPTTAPKMHYVNIQRIRPTKQQDVEDEVESESPVPETK